MIVGLSDSVKPITLSVYCLFTFLLFASNDLHRKGCFEYFTLKV